VPAVVELALAMVGELLILELLELAHVLNGALLCLGRLGGNLRTRLH
jgi:hypothetical protein